MPGAPNRPPERPADVPLTPPVPETPQEKALRRLAPSRVALRLDLWKGVPSPELTGPYERAEAAYAAGEFADALSALDLLATRFTEPRWPTLPEPFRRLRVPIPAPMPPHWDPEHALTPPEREARRVYRVAEDQLALAEGSVAWARGHGVPADDLAAWADEAKGLLAREGAGASFFSQTDRIWTAIRERVPAPRAATRPSGAPTAAEPEEA